MNTEQNKSNRQRPREAHVRLTEDEWDRLEKDELLLRRTKPALLREAYFSRLPTKILMDKEGERKFMTEFSRIGNNLNQLTKKANSGELPFQAELVAIRERLDVLYRFVLGSDGLR